MLGVHAVSLAQMPPPFLGVNFHPIWVGGRCGGVFGRDYVAALPGADELVVDVVVIEMNVEARGVDARAFPS